MSDPINWYQSQRSTVDLWFASVDPTLPAPWRSVMDESSGLVFYWNPETNVSQYEHPNPALPAPPHPPPDHYQIPYEYTPTFPSSSCTYRPPDYPASYMPELPVAPSYTSPIFIPHPAPPSIIYSDFIDVPQIPHSYATIPNFHDPQIYPPSSYEQDSWFFDSENPHSSHHYPPPPPTHNPHFTHPYSIPTNFKWQVTSGTDTMSSLSVCQDLMQTPTMDGEEEIESPLEELDSTLGLTPSRVVPSEPSIPSPTAALPAKAPESAPVPAQQKKNLRILVAGGGIEGLVFALAAKKKGFDMVMFEKDLHAVRGEGQYRGPIQIQSKALVALEAIDVDVANEVIRVDCVIGDRINGLVEGVSDPWYVKFDTFTHAVYRGLPVTRVISRMTLQQLLARTVGDDIIIDGSNVINFEDVGEKVNVILENGERFEGDIVVGANGIWSKVRKNLFGLSDDVYSGYTCYTGVADFVPTDIHSVGYRLFLGHKQYFVSSDVGAGKMQWYAFHKEAPGGVDSPNGKKERLLTLFEGWCDNVIDLFIATEEDAIVRRDIYDMMPILTWGKGHVTLLGYYVHAMQPNMGSGGCMAIEDGYQLAMGIDKAMPLILRWVLGGNSLKLEGRFPSCRLSAKASDQLRTWFEDDNTLERAIDGEWFCMSLVGKLEKGLFNAAALFDAMSKRWSEVYRGTLFDFIYHPESELDTLAMDLYSDFSLLFTRNIDFRPVWNPGAAITNTIELMRCFTGQENHFDVHPQFWVLQLDPLHPAMHATCIQRQLLATRIGIIQHKSRPLHLTVQSQYMRYCSCSNLSTNYVVCMIEMHGFLHDLELCIYDHEPYHISTVGVCPFAATHVIPPRERLLGLVLITDPMVILTVFDKHWDSTEYVTWCHFIVTCNVDLMAAVFVTRTTNVHLMERYPSGLTTSMSPTHVQPPVTAFVHGLLFHLLKHELDNISVGMRNQVAATYINCLQNWLTLNILFVATRFMSLLTWSEVLSINFAVAVLFSHMRAILDFAIWFSLVYKGLAISGWNLWTPLAPAQLIHFLYGEGIQTLLSRDGHGSNKTEWKRNTYLIHFFTYAVQSNEAAVIWFLTSDSSSVAWIRHVCSVVDQMANPFDGVPKCFDYWKGLADFAFFPHHPMATYGMLVADSPLYFTNYQGIQSSMPSLTWWDIPSTFPGVLRNHNWLSLTKHMVFLFTKLWVCKLWEHLFMSTNSVLILSSATRWIDPLVGVIEPKNLNTNIQSWLLLTTCTETWVPAAQNAENYLDSTCHSFGELVVGDAPTPIVILFNAVKICVLQLFSSISAYLANLHDFILAGYQLLIFVFWVNTLKKFWKDMGRDLKTIQKLILHMSMVLHWTKWLASFPTAECVFFSQFERLEDKPYFKGAGLLGPFGPP